MQLVVKKSKQRNGGAAPCGRGENSYLDWACVATGQCGNARAGVRKLRLEAFEYHGVRPFSGNLALSWRAHGPCKHRKACDGAHVVYDVGRQCIHLVGVEVGRYGAGFQQMAQRDGALSADRRVHQPAPVKLPETIPRATLGASTLIFAMTAGSNDINATAPS